MEKKLAFCGLICSECPAYIATRENDYEKKKALAEQWSSEEYIVTPEDIDCEGCTSIGSRVFRFCRECEIRLCGLEKELQSCGHCGDYPCHRVSFHLERSPESKERLDDIHGKL